MERTGDVKKNISKLKTDLTKDLLSAGYIIGLIAGIIGFIILINELHTIYKINRIKSWPITKQGGTIRDSYMESASTSTNYSIFVISRSQSHITYRTRASFEYTVNGRTYVSDKVSYYEAWNTNPVVAKVQTDLLARGNKVDIRINPKNPAEAYIYNESFDSYGRLLFGIILTIIGIYVVVKS